MSSNDFKKITWITVSLTLIIWFVSLGFSDAEPVSWPSIKNLISATSVTAIFWILYFKYFWKWPRFRKILFKPDISGTWLGEFQSDWKDENQNGVPPGKFVIVIRQKDFHSLSVIAYSNEMRSISNIESLIIDEKNGIKKLGYIYDQKRATSSKYLAKQGAAELDLSQGVNGRYLRGDFWTLAKSTGYVNVRHTGEVEFIESFEDALKKWPEPTAWSSVTSNK